MKKMLFIMQKLDEGYTVKKKDHNTYLFTTTNNKVILKDFFETLYYKNIK